MKKTLEINPEAYYELVDAIVPHALFESLEDAVDTIQHLQAKDELAKNQQQDLNEYLLYVPALVKVLEWHTTSDQRKRIEEIMSCLKY
jgi:hypothetical protein